MGGDHAPKADNAFVFSLGCEVCAADRKLPVFDEVKKVWLSQSMGTALYTQDCWRNESAKSYN